MKGHFQMLAAYNAWANHRLFEAASNLSDEEYTRNLGAFFNSVHGTLNHLLVADRIWLARLSKQPPLNYTLDQILYDNFKTLRYHRREEDAKIVSFLEETSQTSINNMISFTPLTMPQKVTQPMAAALSHFFNHQTHHRGQAHTLLTQLDQNVESLDLLVFQRETGIGLH